MPHALNRLSLPHPEDVRVERAILDMSGAEPFEIGKILSERGVGGFEPEVLAWFCAHVESSPGPVRFLDIGANVGIFSLALRAMFGAKVSATAFEPLRELAGFVERAAANNGVSVELRDCALSNFDGTAQFYVSSKSDSSNSLNRTFRPHKQVIDVQVRKLDTIYPAAAEAHYMLKIDTESTEPDVLDGARAFIARYRPPIVCEVLAGRTEDRLAALVAEMKYVAIHLTSAPRWDGEAKVIGDPSYKHRDWLFVPEPPAEAVRRRFAAWFDALTRAE